MLDFCIRYVTYLDRLLIDGIKWLVDNDYLYYVIMCLVPFVGATIRMIEEISLKERYQKLEQAQKADITKLMEIYSYDELKHMKERIEKGL